MQKNSVLNKLTEKEQKIKRRLLHYIGNSPKEVWLNLARQFNLKEDL